MCIGIAPQVKKFVTYHHHLHDHSYKTQGKKTDNTDRNLYPQKYENKHCKSKINLGFRAYPIQVLVKYFWAIYLIHNMMDTYRYTKSKELHMIIYTEPQAVSYKINYDKKKVSIMYK
jgi:hypothetical protein